MKITEKIIKEILIECEHSEILDIEAYIKEQYGNVTFNWVTVTEIEAWWLPKNKPLRPSYLATKITLPI